MKKILLGIFILSSTVALAQNDRDDHRDRKDRDDRRTQNDRDDHRNRSNNRVPASVQRSFDNDYPNTQNAQWNYTNGQWRSSYKDANNRNIESYYNANGQRIDTHAYYDANDLPTPVRDRANRTYNSNYRAYRIDRQTGQPIYQVRSKDGRTLYVDENGNKTVYRDRH